MVDRTGPCPVPPTTKPPLLIREVICNGEPSMWRRRHLRGSSTGSPGERAWFGSSDDEVAPPPRRSYLRRRTSNVIKASSQRNFNRKFRRERAWSIERDRGSGSSDDEVAPPPR
ncbi:hypothetical protein JTE90_019404 [Oedothorax gibbosus]|uniref:Uncharacterized protein n=1 Tax=Oedothorax gibbosus TaxID=931172 RepID=A0AAV6TUW2_9ARAC|nr:hypothetical protein JTE90_019404 [Oedothorax gibbosus]